MYTMTYLVGRAKLNTVLGMPFIYLGFGAGLSVFMLCGFIRGIPRELEEAATIDGCNPVQTFFLVVLPLLKPTAVTVAILNTMWIWNDYLLPYLVLGTEKKTVPVAIQIAHAGCLRLHRLRRADGDAGAGDDPHCGLLSVLPKIYYQRRGSRCG